MRRNGRRPQEFCARETRRRSRGFRNELLFTGRRSDAETGLQLNRHRFYHQQLGRWVSRDPIDYSGQGPNLYQYVDARPASLFDPLGLIPQDKGWDWPTFGEYCYYFCGSFDEDFDEDLGTIGNCAIEALELAVDLVPAGKGAKCCKTVLGAGRGKGKGERRQAGKPSGTPDPWKHYRPHPTDPDRVIFTDPHTGKKIIKPKPPGFPEPKRKPTTQAKPDDVAPIEIPYDWWWRL